MIVTSRATPATGLGLLRGEGRAELGLRRLVKFGGNKVKVELLSSEMQLCCDPAQPECLLLSCLGGASLLLLAEEEQPADSWPLGS